MKKNAVLRCRIPINMEKNISRILETLTNKGLNVDKSKVLRVIIAKGLTYEDELIDCFMQGVE